jgi:hypothetical protein
VSARCSNGAANSFLSGLIIRCRAGCDGWRNSSGSFAIFAAIRRASSGVSSFAADRRPGSSSK